MSNLTHNAAIDAICNCASSVSALSYQEAIEGYFKLRGLLIPPAPSLAAQDGLVEAVADALLSAFLAGRGSITARERNAHKPEPSMEHFRSIALSAIKGDKS